MIDYRYSARDHLGVQVAGQIAAENEKQAARLLEGQGLTPISIIDPHAVDLGAQIETLFSSFQKIRTDDMIALTRQLASVIDAGIPLLEGLEAVSEQIVRPKLKLALQRVRKQIEGGDTFSEALARDKGVFSPLMINMVRAGERAGILPDVLDRISNLLEKDAETLDKIKAATRYPLIVLITLSVAFVVINVGIIPKFADFFASFKLELPWATKLLVLSNKFIMAYWPFVMIGVILASFGFNRILATEKGRYQWDKLMLTVPVFGPLFIKIYLSRFARTFSAMLAAGVPILEGLAIVAATVGNVVITKVIMEVRDQVNQGKSLTEPMKNSHLFPPIVTSMIAIGEKSGTLEKMLNKMADYFDREVNYTITNLTPLLEPILIFGLAGLLLIFALGIFLPMWDIVRITKSF
ncbi:MAG: type II secretion system F family protein [Candidatus Margulisiibacteriota bacterium]